MRTIKLSIILASLGWAVGCGSPEPEVVGGSSSTIPTDETYTTAGGESLDAEDEGADEGESEDAPGAQ